MGETRAYLLTWTTYGTWLPGDARGWVDRHRRHGEVFDAPSPPLESHARSLMKEARVTLDDPQRACAEQAMRTACSQGSWYVHVLAVRSNHVHVVITAAGPETSPGKVMGVLKRCASKALISIGAIPAGQRVWTRYGSKRVLRSEQAMAGAIRYVQNQETSWIKRL